MSDVTSAVIKLGFNHQNDWLVFFFLYCCLIIGKFLKTFDFLLSDLLTTSWHVRSPISMKYIFSRRWDFIVRKPENGIIATFFSDISICQKPNLVNWMVSFLKIIMYPVDLTDNCSFNYGCCCKTLYECSGTDLPEHLKFESVSRCAFQVILWLKLSTSGN